MPNSSSNSHVHSVKNQLIVPAEYAGQRLDNYLMRHFRDLPKGVLYRLIRTGQVRINKKRCKPMQKLLAEDIVRIPPHLWHELQGHNENIDHADKKSRANKTAKLSDSLRQLMLDSVLFEDESILVINKPSGMAVHGGSGVSLGIIEAWRLLKPEWKYLELVHRLDRSTSGCLILAKKRSALRALHEQIRENQVEKKYLALVNGHWSGKKKVRLPLLLTHRKGGERHVIVSDSKEAKQALTYFNLQSVFALPIDKLKPKSNYELKKEKFSARAKYGRGVKRDFVSLMDVKLETGRTHQIRVHALAQEHALAGDERYGDEVLNKRYKSLGLKRLFLHAHYLAFTHPRSGEEVAVSAPLPHELSGFLDGLNLVS